MKKKWITPCFRQDDASNITNGLGGGKEANPIDHEINGVNIDWS